MLKGRQVSLRPLREGDIKPLHDSTLDLETRGPWYPLPGTPLARYAATFAESGFWSQDKGIFAIVDGSDRMIGIVGWEQLTGDLPDIEVSYRLLDQANRGKGITTEALGLLAGWLFDTGHMNRLRANVHVDNKASRRVCEKSGFTQEATARSSWYNRGKWHDVAVYTLTRDEFEAARTTAASP
jgi:RimJ/RimL family protein N-acetyltransferase